MQLLKKTLPAFAVALLAAASAQAQSNCLEHYRAEMRSDSSVQYQTWASFPTVSPQAAFDRAYAFTAEHGFTVNSVDRTAGVIAASQPVSFGHGQSVPLNIVVKPDNDGAVVSIVYSTPGGSASPEEAIQAHFCKTMAAIAGE